MNGAARSPKVPRRALDGVLLLDKPLGLSSNDALIRAKRIYLAKKAGHTGTLDPLATGLLPLCFGEATKFSQDLLEADKTYEATMRLGIRLTTGDDEGEAIDTRGVTCSKGTYVRALAEGIGEALGCGAHLVALRRTGVGALTLENSVTLDALSDATETERDTWLQPVD